MYFVSGRSLNSSRETEFGASRSLADFYQRREQHCSRPAAFKNATVRERTHTCLWRFSGRLAGVVCKPPFAEFVKQDSVQAVIAGHLRRCEKTAAEWPHFKSGMVRNRPVAACRAIEKRTPRTLFCIENGPRRGANSAWLERRSIVERTSSMS